MFEDFISDGVPVSIVDGFEIVQATEDQCETFVKSFGMFNGMFETVIEYQPAGKSCQRIVRGQIGLVVRIFTLVCDIGEDTDILLELSL